MKMTRFLLCVLLVFGLSVYTAGCGINYQYNFTQSVENIERVVIAEYHYDTNSVSPIHILSKEAASNILQEIPQMICYKHFGDHTRDLGETVVQIIYTDGQAEIIGAWNSASVDLDGEWTLGLYYFGDSQWDSFISKYKKTD